jgi:hypothetical protein
LAEIHQQLRSQGLEQVIVAGTLNAVSYCFSLASLLQKTDLQDISKHPSFNVAGEKETDVGWAMTLSLVLSMIVSSWFLCFEISCLKSLKSRTIVW